MRLPIVAFAAFALLPGGSPAQDGGLLRSFGRAVLGRPVPKRAPEAKPAATRLRARVVDEADRPFSQFSLRLLGNGKSATAAVERGLDDVVRGGSGTFEYLIVRERHEPARGTLVLSDGETTDLGTLRLEPGSATIDGRVFDDRGRPVSGAGVGLFGPIRSWRVGDDEPTDRTRTDASGVFRFERVPEGTAFVKVMSGATVAMPAAEVAVRRGSTEEIEFRPATGTIALRVQTSGREADRTFDLVLRDEGHRVETRWRIAPPGVFPSEAFVSRPSG